MINANNAALPPRPCSNCDRMRIRRGIRESINAARAEGTVYIPISKMEQFIQTTAELVIKELFS